MADQDLQDALGAFVEFLDHANLTESIAGLERALEGKSREAVMPLLSERAITADLLHGATILRDSVGRINDVIHATAIALAIPQLLDPGEVLRRPSLAAGNDPSRPYDLETDRRVAEFKLGRWTGHDAMRKRHLVKDLVHLAAEPSDRVAQLYVLGSRPLHFLRTTKSKIAWALDRFPATRNVFEQQFGSLEATVPEFVQGGGAHVEVLDLERELRDLFGTS